MPQPPPRPRSRRGQGDQLRDEILAAVNHLLDTWGSDEKLTMRAVAQQVGVAAPSIYLHFSDKAELVWAALADKYTQLSDAMAQAGTAVAGAGPRAVLLAEVHAYCRFALENPGHYRLMYQVRQPATAHENLGRHPARQVSGRLRRALQSCADAGHPLTLPLHQCAHTLWTAMHGMVSIHQTMSPTAAAEDLLALVDGLADSLVGTQTVCGATIPPQTALDRMIAATIDDGGG